MKDLTVDTGILMTGSRLSDPTQNPFVDSCEKLITSMLERGDVFLVLDKRGKIEAEYNMKLKGGTLGHQFIQLMASKNKIKFIVFARENRRVRVQLHENHFDWGDYPFVRTAAASMSKKIVSHDPNYSTRVRQVLRRGHEIVVDCAKDAHIWIDCDA